MGRGAWAGPLIVGAVSLNREISGLRDSKTLNKTQRQSLALEIYKSAAFAGIGRAESAEIDELGLSQAHFLAYQRAIADLDGHHEIIIDGNINYLPELSRVRCIIKADQTVPEVSAASIIAKVYRDNLMAELAIEFPNYGFEKHVGYGTARHIQTLSEFGVTAFHRKSCKPIKAIISG